MEKQILASRLRLIKLNFHDCRELIYEKTFYFVALRSYSTGI